MNDGFIYQSDNPTALDIFQLNNDGSLNISTTVINNNPSTFSAGLTVGDVTVIGQLPNPEQGGQLSLPVLQVGGTIAGHDIILGETGNTKFISGINGTYIYNNLNVSGTINNSDLTNKLNAKANQTDLNTLTNTVNNKEDKTDLITNYYNKNDVNSLIVGKANSSDVYTKSYIDTSLAQKADTSNVYTKTMTDSALSQKANSSDVSTSQIGRAHV